MYTVFKLYITKIRKHLIKEPQYEVRQQKGLFQDIKLLQVSSFKWLSVLVWYPVWGVSSTNVFNTEIKMNSGILMYWPELKCIIDFVWPSSTSIMKNMINVTTISIRMTTNWNLWFQWAIQTHWFTCRLALLFTVVFWMLNTNSDS